MEPPIDDSGAAISRIFYPRTGTLQAPMRRGLEVLPAGRRVMTHYNLERESNAGVKFIHAALLSFPIACFTLALLTDIAYWQTENLLWLHFSEWLLLAGLVGAGIEFGVVIIEWLARRVRPGWLVIIGGIVVMLLAIGNSFVHTVDGWTAVVPNGLILSGLTVLAMIVTGWLGSRTGSRRWRDA
jgi:uncharacterized membrane protein